MSLSEGFPRAARSDPLAGGGDVGSLLRHYDWSATPLGSVDGWPQPLKTLVGVMLAANQPMFVAWGPQRTMLYNEAYAPLLADRHPDALGRPLLEVWADAADILTPLVTQVFAGEPVHMDDLELKLIRRGRPVTAHFAFSYTPVRDAAGHVAGLYCACTETTEQFLAREALRASEEFGRRVLQSSADCIKVLSLDGAMEFMSEGGMVVMEVDDFSEVQGAYWPDFWLGEERPKVLAAIAEAKGGGTGRFQGFATTAKGSPRWWDVVVTAISGADGAPERLLSVSRDITASRAAETMLRELNETLETRVAERTAERDRLWTLSEDLLARADYSGKMSAVSPAWTRALGFTQTDLLSRPYADFMHPDDAGVTLDALTRMGETATPTRFENRILCADGSYKSLEWTVAPEPDGFNFIAVGRDVTAERTRQAELESAQEALRQSQKMEAVGQLTGGIAHDFNNLLAGISGSLELIRMRMAQGRTAQVEKYVTAAQGAANRAASLTHRLLAFSRRQTLAPKPTDIKQLVAGMTDLIGRTAGPQVTLELVNTVGLWPSLIDPSQLENAVLNLCINARDAMPDGGTITIETANRWLDRRMAKERGLEPGQYISLCVSDTGTGMSPEVVAKAFDPFFTTKPIGVGTGLGLSMIYGFAKQSGGAVNIYSEVGEGTNVCIYLPRHLGEAETAEPAADLAAAPRGEGETVLVVDDEPTVRMLVSEVLGDLGYHAVEAEDGAAGLKVLNSGARIDLLVTDVGLPGGMNGRQVADAARVVRPGLKVLFITGYAENAVLSHGHLDPGMHVMTKPFAMEALATRIRELIEA